MRTTLTLDKDVAAQVKEAQARLQKPFKQIVNDALRAGLAQVHKPRKAKPYDYTPHAMGLRAGVDLNNIGELLAQVEGEDYK